MGKFSTSLYFIAVQLKTLLNVIDVELVEVKGNGSGQMDVLC